MLPRGRVLLLAWTLAALCLVCSPAGISAGGGGLDDAIGTVAEAVAPDPATPSAAPKIALFGVDAADWRVIDPLVAAGRLPTFARLKQVASLGVLRADPPLLSPIIWTTIATGRPPEEHGVLDFMVDAPGGGQAPVNGGARRVKALWEIWSEAGRRVLVAGWWATWPADHVSGLIASDRIATPHLVERGRPDAGLVYPPSALPDVSRRIVEPASLDYAALSRLLPDHARGVRARGRGLARVARPALPRPDRPFPCRRGRRAFVPANQHRDGGVRAARLVGRVLRGGGHRLAPVRRGSRPCRSSDRVRLRGGRCCSRRRRTLARSGDARDRPVGPWLPAGRRGCARGPGGSHRGGHRLAPAVRHRGRRYRRRARRHPARRPPGAARHRVPARHRAHGARPRGPRARVGHARARVGRPGSARRIRGRPGRTDCQLRSARPAGGPAGPKRGITAGERSINRAGALARARLCLGRRRGHLARASQPGGDSLPQGRRARCGARAGGRAARRAVERPCRALAGARLRRPRTA